MVWEGLLVFASSSLSSDRQYLSRSLEYVRYTVWRTQENVQEGLTLISLYKLYWELVAYKVRRRR